MFKLSIQLFSVFGTQQPASYTDM